MRLRHLKTRGIAKDVISLLHVVSAVSVSSIQRQASRYLQYSTNRGGVKLGYLSKVSQKTLQTHLGSSHSRGSCFVFCCTPSINVQ